MSKKNIHPTHHHQHQDTEYPPNMSNWLSLICNKWCQRGVPHHRAPSPSCSLCITHNTCERLVWLLFYRKSVHPKHEYITYVSRARQTKTQRRVLSVPIRRTTCAQHLCAPTSCQQLDPCWWRKCKGRARCAASSQNQWPVPKRTSRTHPRGGGIPIHKIYDFLVGSRDDSGHQNTTIGVVVCVCVCPFILHYFAPHTLPYCRTLKSQIAPHWRRYAAKKRTAPPEICGK